MDFLKKKKEKERYINESNLDKYSDKEIIEYLKNYYPIGCKVDQGTAYSVASARNNIMTITSHSVVIIRNCGETGDEYMNISIGGKGIWSDNKSNKFKRTLAKVILDGKQFQ